MKYIPLIAILCVISCAEDGRYPVSGEECGPDDAVLTLDAGDCAIPSLG